MIQINSYINREILDITKMCNYHNRSKFSLKKQMLIRNLMDQVEIIDELSQYRVVIGSTESKLIIS